MNSNRYKAVAVFCGSHMGNNPAYQAAARELANELFARDITLVYGGADVGLMKVIADHMLEIGGKVIGVIPQSLVDVEIAHESLTELHVVDSMNRRKELIAELSDGFVMMPGGVGSLDELFEMVTLGLLGYQDKPCGILNVDHYYDQLIGFLDNAMNEGFLKPVYREMLMVAETSEALLQQFISYEAPTSVKWQAQTDIAQAQQA